MKENRRHNQDKQRIFIYLLQQQKPYKLYLNTQVKVTKKLLYNGEQLRACGYVGEID